MHARRKSRTRRKPRAATKDVLGGIPVPAKVPSRWRKQYTHLIQLRNKLLNRQAGLTKDALDEQPTFSTHMADAGTDTFDRDFALGLLSSEQDAVYEIEAALDRIRDGTYGNCELTGKPIEPKRLEPIPWTRFTAQAEKELEREGEVKRTRLGSRDTVAKVEPSDQNEPEAP